MPSKSTALTTKVENGSPYQLSSEQTLKASKALLSHIKSTSASAPAGKVSLIANEDEETIAESAPIWLNLTTKTHISDAKRLKPTKIALPHPLNTSPTTTICLITADPQRTYKDIVASPAFPADLAKRITKVVGISKLRKKFSQYEAQRKLFAEHDLFLADDRIVTMLPKALGKTFYKSTAKRPIPVSISTPAPKTEGKRIAKAKGEEKSTAGTPQAITAEVEKALKSALVHISPSVSTAVRVGYANMTAEELAANVEVVVNEMIEKLVTKKWRNVRSIHIKGETSAALPIWLADELWVDEQDILDEEAAQKLKSERANVGKKRKAVEAAPVVEVEKKKKKQKVVESNDDTLDKEIAKRKDTLRKQKKEASKSVDEEEAVLKVAKKGKKAKVTA